MSKIFQQGCQNCIQRVQRNTLRKNSFEKNTINIFEHWAEKFSAFWPKFLDRVKKTQGLREHWDLFWKKVIFSSFWEIELKKFSAGLSILHSTHPWHLEKSFLLKKVIFLFFFGDWAKKFRASGTIFLAGLS